MDFGSNDNINVGTGSLIRIKNEILGVITTAHSFVQKRRTSNGELKIKQAVDIEFYIGLDGNENYLYKFHIYNFFVHPEYVKHFDVPSCYDVAIALIDLENVEPSIEEISIGESDANDVSLKPLNKIPDCIKSKIGELGDPSNIKVGDEIFIAGYPLSFESGLMGMSGHVLQILDKSEAVYNRLGQSARKVKGSTENSIVNSKGVFEAYHEENIIITYNDILTTNGQSGSPIMVNTKDGWRIIGIHVGDFDQRKSKYFDINEFLIFLYSCQFWS